MTISHGLRRRFQKSFFFIYYWAILWVLAVLLSGCAGAPLARQPQQRGLLQILGDDQSSVRSTEASGLGVHRGEFHVPPYKGPSKEGFIWPLHQGQISSYFGHRSRDFHDGIDIRIAPGTAIFAARDGTVIYSNHKIRGYGNLIIVRHDDHYATVYAHNRKNLVRRGEKVRQGQLIGLVGATGRATGPHLHFELRYRELPQDPLGYLPGYRNPAMARK